MDKKDVEKYVGKLVKLSWHPPVDPKEFHTMIGTICSTRETFIVFDVNDVGKEIPVYYKNIEKIKEVRK